MNAVAVATSSSYQFFVVVRSLLCPVYIRLLRVVDASFVVAGFGIDNGASPDQNFT